MKDYRKFKAGLLKKPKIKKTYEELAPEFAIVESIIKARLSKGITQSELARRIGTKQSAIARLESGQYNPTLSFLGKVAKALDAQLSISVHYRG